MIKYVFDPIWAFISYCLLNILFNGYLMSVKKGKLIIKKVDDIWQIVWLVLTFSWKQYIFKIIVSSLLSIEHYSALHIDHFLIWIKYLHQIKMQLFWTNLNWRSAKSVKNANTWSLRDTTQFILFDRNVWFQSKKHYTKMYYFSQKNTTLSLRTRFLLIQGSCFF